MASEGSPVGGTPPRMTKAQMHKYLRDMKAMQEAAKAKLDPEKERQEKKSEIAKLEDKLDDVF